MLKIFSTGINAYMGTSERGLSHSFKNHGAVGNGLTGIKNYIRNVSLHFELEPNTLGFWIVLKDKNPKNCGPANVGLQRQKFSVLWHIFIW